MKNKVKVNDKPINFSKSLNDLSHNSPNGVCDTPTIATSLIISPFMF